MTDTNPKRHGRRGQRSKERRSIQRAARLRHDAWLNAYTNTNTVPLRVRIEQLTADLDAAYQRKRSNDQHDQ